MQPNKHNLKLIAQSQSIKNGQKSKVVLNKHSVPEKIEKYPRKLSKETYSHSIKDISAHSFVSKSSISNVSFCNPAGKTYAFQKAKARSLPKSRLKQKSLPKPLKSELKAAKSVDYKQFRNALKVSLDSKGVRKSSVPKKYKGLTAREVMKVR